MHLPLSFLMIPERCEWQLKAFAQNNVSIISGAVQEFMDDTAQAKPGIIFLKAKSLSLSQGLLSEKDRIYCFSQIRRHQDYNSTGYDRCLKFQ